jgi:hypothetical protein
MTEAPSRRRHLYLARTPLRAVKRRPDEDIPATRQTNHRHFDVFFLRAASADVQPGALAVTRTSHLITVSYQFISRSLFR